MKKIQAFILAVVFLFSLLTFGCTQKPVVGIAWRSDTDSEFYTNVVIAVNEAGGRAVLLDQVIADYLEYDENNNLIGASSEIGDMNIETAELIKDNLWNDTNVEEVLRGIDAVIFTGGDDISPSLLKEPQEWHGIYEEIHYNATRDSSDYILMSYCIENDIRVMGICRGMQMLAVASGAEIIQDIPAYYDEIGKDYDYQHRNETDTPDSYRDYVPHDVRITEGSLAYGILNTDILKGAPSWHHQAVSSVDGTDLRVTGATETNGEEIIEIVEHKDKEFVIGFQFHPEASIGKMINDEENAADFMDYEAALCIFRTFLDKR